MSKSTDFLPWESYAVCCHCGKPLDDSQRMKDALKVSHTASWAKHRLRILAETLAEREGMEWIAEELREIEAGIEIMPDAQPSYLAGLR